MPLLFVILLLACDSLFASGPSNRMRDAKDETFAAIQVICNVTSLEGLLCHHSPDDEYQFTNRGLYLTHGDAYIALATPWGSVTTTVRSKGTRIKEMAELYEEFKILRQHIELKFLRCDGEVGRNRLVFPPKIYKERDFSRPIAAMELDEYRNTDTYIATRQMGLPSIYKIESVRGMVLPIPEFSATDPASSAEVVAARNAELKKDWEKRTKEYRDFKKLAFKKLVKTGSLGVELLRE